MNLTDNRSAGRDYPDFPNYAELEALDRAESEVWLNRFPWLTSSERELRALADHPDFPGVCAEKAEYDAFALRRRRDSVRRVSCIFNVGWGKIRGAFDLVSGTAYLLDNGQYTLGEELPDSVDIEFADEPGAKLSRVQLVSGFANVAPVDSLHEPALATLGEILSRTAQPVSTASLAVVVERLASVGKLPPVEGSVNGKRFDSYHPM